jgi:predicted TIM-barrel fold metal-dependent hydrolase
MKAIDVFTHVFPTTYRRALDRSIPNLGGRHPSLREPLLRDFDMRLVANPPQTLQVTASVVIDDQIREKIRTRVAQQTNTELATTVLDHPELFEGAIARITVSDIAWSTHYIADTIARSDILLGIQMLTTESGKLVTDPSFDPIRTALAAQKRPLWIRSSQEHAPGNEDIFEKSLDDIRSFFAAMIEDEWTARFAGMPVIIHEGVAALADLQDLQNNLHGIYLDTAGATSEQIEHAASLFGADRLLFSSDAPFGPDPLSVEQNALDVIDHSSLGDDEKMAIKLTNWESLRSSIPMHVQTEKDTYQLDKAEQERKEAEKKAADDDDNEEENSTE